MSKLFYLVLSIIFSAFCFVNPLDEATYGYVDQYKNIAIVEMYRSGIPASITLAQGLLESSTGSSDLAIYANNHFGIKCKSYWTGKTFQHKDDDFDEQGNIVPSCFRAYDNAIDSYIDHSNFLMTTKWYKPLFSLDPKDYTAWAYGLKEMGYATDPQYAQKLIDKIEKYQLYIYDQAPNPLNPPK